MIFKPNMRGYIQIANKYEKKKRKKIFKKYPHTYILKILSHIGKYSVPIDNINKELENWNKKAPQRFWYFIWEYPQIKILFQYEYIKWSFIWNENKKSKSNSRRCN